MNVSFPPAPAGSYLGRVIDTLRRAFLTVISYNTEAPRVILQSPGGKNYALTISDGGALTITNAAQQIAGTLAPATVTLPFADATDNTKAVQLDISGVSPGTTRTLAVPDASGVLALTSNIPVTFASIKVTLFLSSGTFPPDAKCIAGYAVAKGGGGGSTTLTVNTSLSYGGGGGGEGATAIKWFTAADVAGGVTVTVGASASDANGTASSFGSLAIGAGGKAPASAFIGGKGGALADCTGDVCVAGAPGGAGIIVSATQADGTPGSGGGAGGAVGTDSGGTEFHNAVAAEANTGGGASGASSRSSGPGNVLGAAGGSGFVYVVEYLSA